jgi:hypothetical protein
MVKQPRIGVFYVVHDEMLYPGRFGATSQSKACSVESKAVKGKVGGWSEMTASLGASQFVSQLVSEEKTWSPKLKNPHC